MIAAAGKLALLLATAPAFAQAPWYEGFEGPDPTWSAAEADVRYRVLEHRRIPDEAHTGQRCERVGVWGNSGTYVHFVHDVGRPYVIEELLPTVWVKSDRPGLQFAARVVLPRTEDPRTGRPISTLIQGTTYTRVGSWQQLRLQDVPKHLAQQVRVLRAELRHAVDPREAYVDRVVLNVFGGPGVTNVSIDDLDIAGFVGYRPGPPTAQVSQTRVADTATAPIESEAGPALSPDRPGWNSMVPPRRPLSSDASDGGAAGSQGPRLIGSVLLQNDRPLLPRIIRHRGEPLEFLQKLGFNAVWIAELPTPAMAEEARLLGLWLVCPPPRPTTLDFDEAPSAGLANLGDQYASVLAWDLGRHLPAEQLESTRRWAEEVRAADSRSNRPLICSPNADLRGYSRHVDLLLIDRRPLGTSQELSDYGAWIRRQPRLARPGTPVWTTVQTQPSPALRQQLAALDPQRVPPLAVASEQIRLLVYTAITAGSRGLLFESDTPLDADDPETRQRAMTLELLNYELQLIEPWAASGSFLTTADASEPGVVASVLRSDRTRLVLPVWSVPGAQCVPGQSAVDRLSLLVPGVSESSSAYVYQVTAGGLQPLLRHERATGGVRLTLEEFGLTDMVLFAQDPLAIAALTRSAAQFGPRLSKLKRDLATRKLHTVQEVAEQLPKQTKVALHSVAQLSTARKDVQWCDGHLAAGDYRKAEQFARRAMRTLRLLERSFWEEALEHTPSPVTSPGALGYTTLPWHQRLLGRISRSQPGPNRLPGGDFEQLAAMLSSGWQHRRHNAPGLETAADLVLDAAHSGALGLRLTAWPLDPEQPPSVVEAPPVWMTSPPVAVEAGQLIQISGWVNVPAPITGSVDGLMIFDSISGEDLGERIGQTDGWQWFNLYRIAPRSGPVTVTFALTGLGEARVDDVMVQTLTSSSSADITRLPPVRNGWRR